MNTLPSPPAHIVDSLLKSCIAEDLGVTGDITSTAIFPADHRSEGRVIARQAGVIAGLGIGTAVFRHLDGQVEVDVHVRDGARVEAGTVLATLRGDTRAILSGERILLNILGHLSGIASATRDIVDRLDTSSTSVADTRKTTPGLRAVEKYAVRCGGGSNHRMGLHDAVMIKDNHVAAAGGVTEALAAVQASVGHTVSIVVEVDRLDQIEDAITGGADVILLDNLRGEELRAGVEMIDGRAVAEASGSMTPEVVVEVAASGVDIISMGWITHSAPRLDVALDF